MAAIISLMVLLRTERLTPARLSVTGPGYAAFAAGLVAILL